jgi:hypothetical protein
MPDGNWFRLLLTGAVYGLMQATANFGMVETGIRNGRPRPMVTEKQRTRRKEGRGGEDFDN